MRLFFRQFSAELLKLFARKRTWMGFVAFAMLEMLIVVMLQREGPKNFFGKFIEKSGGFFADYFGGLTLAFLVMAYTVILLGALYLALVGGDIVSKEIEDGTMRMTLVRPVSRLRVLFVKYLAALLYCFALIFFVGATALLVGYLWRGSGGLLAMAPEEDLLMLWPEREGLVRFCAALPLLSLSLCTIVSVAFFFSCCDAKPAAATALTLSIFMVSFILNLMPHFASYKGWFPTARMATWVNIFRADVPWSRMLENYAILAGMNVTCFIIGCTVFLRRDLKS